MCLSRSLTLHHGSLDICPCVSFSCFWFMSGYVLSNSECVSVTPPVSRLAVEETVDVKQVGMREKVPEKGEQSTGCCFVLANSLTPQYITFPILYCLTILCFTNTAVLCVSILFVCLSLTTYSQCFNHDYQSR